MFLPGKTQRMTDRISVLRTLISNFYLYDTGSGYAAFDCGMNPRLARRTLERLGVAPGEVNAVFLTHSDSDHRGGLSLFPTAIVYLPEAEIPMVTGQTVRMARVYRNGAIDAYQTLAHGQSVQLGDTKVELIAAPGHTPGSACYRIGPDALATGDLLVVNPGGRVRPFSGMMNMDNAVNRTTLQQLVQEGLFAPGRYLLTGHSGAHLADSLDFSGL